MECKGILNEINELEQLVIFDTERNIILIQACLAKKSPPIFRNFKSVFVATTDGSRGVISYIKSSSSFNLISLSSSHKRISINNDSIKIINFYSSPSIFFVWRFKHVNIYLDTL